MKRNIIGFIVIYAIAFTIVLWYGLNHQPVNDGVYEYRAFLDNIENGWQFRFTLVNSSLITTYLPALLHNWFGIDKMFIFRFIPALFYPLMPAFAFLIARRYLTYRDSIISSLVILCSSYFIYFPDMGRVGVALGFLAGMIWALLEKRLVWALVFGVLVIFSHYATSLMALGLVLIVPIIYLILKHKLLKQYIILLCVLAVLIGVWHFGVARYSGNVMFTKLFQTGEYGYPKEYDVNIKTIIDPTTKEQQVQDALLINGSEMPIPKKIEIASNYLVVIIVTFGTILMVRRKCIDLQFKIMALAFYGLIVASVAIPQISVYYGGMRVYFSATILLSTCFIIGIEKLSNWTHTPIIVLSIVILAYYALCTSGIIYLPFGLEKTFPVAVTING